MIKQTKEQRFEKVIDNEYETNLKFEIILPLLNILAGFMLGFSVGNNIYWLTVSLVIMLSLSTIVYLIGLCVYIEGRNVYWRRIK